MKRFGCLWLLLLSVMVCFGVLPLHAYAENEGDEAAEATEYSLPEMELQEEIDSNVGEEVEIPLIVLPLGGNYDIGVNLNECATFGVEVTATNPDGITYQWFQVELDENGNSVDVIIEGATESIYTTTPITRQAIYYCCVTDTYGNTGSWWFRVNVDNQLSVSPLGGNNHIEVTPNERVTLGVEVTAKNADGIIYQWYQSQREPNEYGGVDYSPIEGAKGVTYEAEPVIGVNEYFCSVTDAYGNTDSCWFWVYVDNQLSVLPLGGHKSFLLNPNESATFGVEVTAFNMDGITYQWYKVIGGGWIEISGATCESFETEPFVDPAEYVCIVTDAYGGEMSCFFSTLKNNHLSVLPLDGSPDIYVVTGKKSVILEVTVSADDTNGLNFRWFKPFYDEEGNMTGSAGSNYFYGSNEVRETCAIGYVYEETDVACEVTDMYNNTAYVVFHIHPGEINNHLSIAPVGGVSDIYLFQGKTAVLEVEVSADDTEDLEFRWGFIFEYDEGEIWPGTGFEPYTSSFVVDMDIFQEVFEYFKPNKPASNADAVYFCKVTDKYGNEAVQKFNIFVTEESGFSVSWADGNGEYYVTPGESVTLGVTVTTDNILGLKYQWCQRELNEYDSWVWVLIEGATESTFVASPNSSHTQYSCYVTDTHGNRGSCQFYVWVDNQLRVTQSGGNYYVPVSPNASATLRVEVTAIKTDGLIYQWYQMEENPVNESGSGVGYGSNYVPIEGATGSTYVTGPITRPRLYYCKVTDVYGTSKNCEFEVYVDNHLVVTPVGGDTIGVSPNEQRTLRISISADDYNGITFQWYKNGFAIEGATSTSYTTEAASRSTSYYCDVKDKYGNSRRCDFFIYIDNRLSIAPVGGVSDIYLSRGKTVTLEVEVTAEDTEGLEFWWGYIFEYDEGEIWPGAGVDPYTSSFVVDMDVYLSVFEFFKPNKPASNADAVYYCKVTDKYGNEAVQKFNIYVMEENLIGIIKQPENISVKDGETATFAVEATGENLSYVWEYKMAGSSTWKTWETKKTAQITVPYQANRNGMQLRCKVTSGEEVIRSAEVTLSYQEDN